MLLRSVSAALMISFLSGSALAGSERVYIGIEQNAPVATEKRKTLPKTLNQNIYGNSIYHQNIPKADKPAPKITRPVPKVQKPILKKIKSAPKTERVVIESKKPKKTNLYTAKNTTAAERTYIAPSPFDEKPPLKSRIEANWRYSNDRSIVMTEIWTPLVENREEDSVLYGDLRLMGDNNENEEFNAGIGYRKIVESDVLGEGIVGGLLWYDHRKTQRGSKFNQLTAGGEWLGEQYDLRVNGYIPLNKDETHTQVNPNGTGTGFVGNQIIVNTDQSILEEALPGIDVEVGTRLNFLDNVTDSTRLYAGGYHFIGDQAEDVTGWRTRIASDITSDFQIGARYQDDDVRGSQTYLEATVRFPWGNKKSFYQEGLRSRLDESPERDIDIVSNEKVLDDGLGKPLLNASTGTTQNVIHVDNTAGGGGDGSFETPYNTLAAAEGAATANDLIYVHRGDGTTAGQNAGITLDDAGQMLTGSGTNLLFDRSRFSTANGLDVTNNLLVATETTAPVITNGAGNGVDITADDVFVSGITVDGATTHGVFADNTDNVIIDRITTENNTNNGIRFDLDNVSINNITVKNNISNNNSGSGIFINTINNAQIENINISDNTVNGNASVGINIRAFSGTDIENISIKNNTSDNATANDGFLIWANNAGSTINNLTLSNNSADANSRYGYYLLAQDSAIIDSIDVRNSQATNNTDTGIRIGSIINSNINSVALIGNTSTSNGLHGILAEMHDSNTTDITIQNNTSTGNASAGILVEAEDNSVVTATVNNNTATGNTADGIDVWAYDNSTLTSTLNNNIANTNSTRGIWVWSGTTATHNTTLTNNTVNGNTSDGIVAGAQDNSMMDLVLTNNTANENMLRGINAGSLDNGAMTATLTNNTTNENTLQGALLLAEDSSTLTATLTNNISNENMQDGIAVWADDTSDITSTVTNNTATGNTATGIYSWAGDMATHNTTVNNNTATGNTTQGILLQTWNDGDMTATANNNTVTGNMDTGMYVQAINDTTLTATVSGNTLTGNTLDGIHIDARNNAAISADLQSNTASENSQYGINISDDSTLAQVIDLGGGTLTSTGDNRIFDNTSEEIRIDLDGAELKAENNWWGVATGLAGGEVDLQAGSTIDSDPFLTADPGP